MYKIAWIGTGVMGKPMAYHLADAGYDVTVFNRTFAKAKDMDDRCTVASTIKEAVSGADIIFSIVGFPQDVEGIYLGQDGILEHAKEGAIVIDMTTSSPDLAKRIYEAGKMKNVSALDSPVTGGDLGAINGTLSIMVGGEKEVFDKVEPLLRHMAKAVTYMGAPGNGQHTKLANQICIAGAISATAEALNYALSHNLDPENFLNVINNGSASSWQSINQGPKMVANNMEPGFYIKHFVKDLRLASEAKDTIKMPLTQLVLSEYEELLEKHSNDGTQAIIKYYQNKKSE